MQPLKGEAGPGRAAAGGNAEDRRNPEGAEEEKETMLTTCTVEQDIGEHMA